MNVENVLADVENKKNSEIVDDWENNATKYPNVTINKKTSKGKISFIIKIFSSS